MSHALSSQWLPASPFLASTSEENSGIVKAFPQGRGRCSVGRVELRVHGILVHGWRLGQQGAEQDLELGLHVG